MRTILVRMLLLPLLFVVGCAGMNPTVDILNKGAISYMTVKLSEGDVNGLVRSIAGTGSTAWLLNPLVDLREGELVINGQVRQGNALVFASLTGSLGVANGWFTVNISGLRVGAWTADASALARINKDIAAGLARSAAQNANGTKFVNLTVGGGQLTIGMQTPIQPGNAAIRVDTDANNYYVTLRFTAADLRTYLAPIFGGTDKPWLLNPQITFGNGQMTVTGDLFDKEKNSTSPMSLTLALSGQNGQISLSVVNLTFGTWAVPPEWFKGVNEGLSALATGGAAAGRIDSLVLNASGLTVRVRWPRTP